MQRAERLGIETLRSPVRAPKANAVAEPVIGTLRRECLDHKVILNEPHLRVVLADFARYYNTAAAPATAAPTTSRPLVGRRGYLTTRDPPYRGPFRSAPGSQNGR